MEMRVACVHNPISSNFFSDLEFGLIFIMDIKFKELEVYNVENAIMHIVCVEYD